MQPKTKTLAQSLKGFYDFLQRPLFTWTRPLFLVLLVPLALGLMAPLWHVELTSVDHPGGLSIDVFAFTVQGGHANADLQSVNALHQMIGMRTLDAGAGTDLDWLPFGFGVLALLTLRVAVLGNVRSLVDLSAIVGYFATFAFARFAYKLHGLGHHLSPDAPVKVPPFMPVIFGTQQVGDVTAHSSPALGSYFISIFVLGVFALTAFHLVEGRRRAGRESLAAGTPA